ncbi:MAG: hypothetical protein ACKVT0_22260 [Planctomycetaceae bacterium]
MTPKPTDVPTVDMSPEAIDRRFRMVEALRKLCVSLKQAGERGAMDEANREQMPDHKI